MNERIEELAGQCFSLYEERHIDLQKFAELVVKECASLARSIKKSNDKNIYQYDIAENILNHFGVDE